MTYVHMKPESTQDTLMKTRAMTTKIAAVHTHAVQGGRNRSTMST